MTRPEFNQLSYLQKLALVFTEGTHLVRRDGTGYYADLFYLPGGYFVECFYQAATHQLVTLRSLTSHYSYAPYLAAIALPADLGISI